tara:strand:- start:171 stop:491 length:321 start_codon:yes stop_codon:yes gene_type:complete
MKKKFLSILFFLFIINSSFSINDYKSIEEVKSLNYKLFEDIGLDDDKMNYVSRIIYSYFKKAQHLDSENHSTKKVFTIDKNTEKMLLRVLSNEELKTLILVKHKLK